MDIWWARWWKQSPSVDVKRTEHVEAHENGFVIEIGDGSLIDSSARLAQVRGSIGGL